MEDTDKTLFVKTADGSVWEVIKEFPKKYEVRFPLRMFISKYTVVEKFYKDTKSGK